jgi:hypothetical protein
MTEQDVLAARVLTAHGALDTSNSSRSSKPRAAVLTRQP